MRLSYTPTFKDTQSSQVGDRPGGLESILEVSSPVTPTAPPPSAIEKKFEVSVTTTLERSTSTIEAPTRDNSVSKIRAAPRPQSTIGALQSGIGKSKVRKVTPSLDLTLSRLRPFTSPANTELNRASARESFIYASGESLHRAQSSYELPESPEEEKSKSRNSGITLLEFIARETATFDNSADIGVVQGVVMDMGVVNEPGKDDDSVMSRGVSNASSSKSLEANKGPPVPQEIPEVPRIRYGSNQDKVKKGGWVSSFAKRVWGVRTRS
jgi:hypothetical protein